MPNDLSDFAELQKYLTLNELAELDQLLSDVEIPIWSPLPGPQTEAFNSDADELFYGGAAGGGKTDLLLGVSLIAHWRSIVFRREFQQLKGIRDRSQEIFGDIAKYNGSDMIWRFPDGHRIEFGAAQFEGDEQKYQGRPHDLKAFDEITHFTKAQFMFLKGWNRTTKINPVTGGYYRSRIICAGNPPTSDEGQWVIQYWAPWLDPHHPNPAKPGELRWFITDEDGEDREVSSRDPVYMKINNMETQVFPRSRTFIRARVSDNPHLLDSGYLSILQSLPEPLRSRMLTGDFGVANDEDKWQVIPTQWILMAQARWAPTYEEYLVKLADRRAEEVKKKVRALNSGLASEAIAGTEDSKSPPDADESTGDSQREEQHTRKTIVDGILRDTVENLGNTSAKSSEVGNPTIRAQFTETRRSDNRAVDGHRNTTEAQDPLNYKDDKEVKKIEDLNWGGIGVDMSALLTPEQRKLNADKLNMVRSLAGEVVGSLSHEVGIDVSRGGRDKSVFSERIGAWFATLKLVPGIQTPDGSAVVDKIVEFGFDRLRCKIDVVGVGSSPVDVGRLRGIEVIAMNGANSSIGTDRSGTLGFVNARSEWVWLLREALDPKLGLEIALPPDSEMTADLTAIRWSLASRGIQVEDKQKVKKRLMRSPDRGDAVINAFAQKLVLGEGFLQYYKEEAGRAKEILSQIEESDRGPG